MKTRLRRFRMQKSCCFARAGHSAVCLARRMEHTLRHFRFMAPVVGLYRASEMLTERARRQESGR